MLSGSRSGHLSSAALLAMLLIVAPLPARAGTGMVADGEPGKGWSAPPSRFPGLVTTPGPFSLSDPTRIDVTLAWRPGAAEETAWCLYRITGYARPMKQALVSPGEEICMSCQELFEPSPQSAEFRFHDRGGRDLGSAYGELVTTACGLCALEARQRYSIYRR